MPESEVLEAPADREKEEPTEPDEDAEALAPGSYEKLVTTVSSKKLKHTLTPPPPLHLFLFKIYIQEANILPFPRLFRYWFTAVNVEIGI